MMNIITRNWNIVAILTKNKDRKQFFFEKKLFGLHTEETILKSYPSEKLWK